MDGLEAGNGFGEFFFFGKNFFASKPFLFAGWLGVDNVEMVFHEFASGVYFFGEPENVVAVV